MTISDTAEVQVNARIRADQTYANGVVLNAHTNIQAGGTLAFLKTVNGPAGSIDGFHTVKGNITGNGTTAKESVVNLQLGIAGTKVVGGGVDWLNSTGNLIVNGTDLGGLKVTGPAAYLTAMLNTVRPGAANTTISQGVTGTGGYLTIAPTDGTYALGAGGAWTDPDVGLRVIDSYKIAGAAGTGRLQSGEQRVVDAEYPDRAQRRIAGRRQRHRPEQRHRQRPGDRRRHGHRRRRARR